MCALISLAGLFVGIRYFFRAFPEASIDFRVTREQSQDAAEAFLRGLGIDPAGYRHASVFGFDGNTKTFLERELGIGESNQLLDSTVRLWRWQHRWFRPLQKEEFSVELTTRGELAAFRHELPEDAPGDDLDETAAKAIAERFLTSVSERPLESLTFLEASAQKRPKRTDHTFVYKLADLDVHGADYRFEVQLAGGRPSGYREFMQLPDAWVRDYESLRSRNELAAQVASVLLVATLAAMLVYLVGRIRRGDVRWATAAILGGITTVLLSASQLNELPAALYGYDTTQSFAGFLAIAILRALAAGSAGGIFIFLLSASGEPFYRDRFPKQLSLSSLVRPRAFATREFFLATVVGLTLTCFFFAYENVFYIIAHSLGAWSPREVPYSELLSTVFPWAFVLFFGWFPAVSEEFLSRMFSIPFLERIGKNTAVAVVVSAFVWGFAHANYPNQPFFIRGLEVGIAGVVFGLVFLRFGIVSVVVCHFSVDALYAALALIRSPSWYQKSTGAAAAGIFVLAVVASIVGYLRRGGFVVPEVTNEAEGSAPVLAESAPQGVAAPARDIQPLPRPVLLGGLVVAAAFAGLWFLPIERFGSWVEMSTTRGEARQRAETYLTDLGFDVLGHRSAVVSDGAVNTDASQYLQSMGGITVAERFYRDLVPTPSWRVRLFMPGRHEEYRVRVDTASDRVLEFLRVLPDDAEGARIEPEAAATLAERFLRSQGSDPGHGERKDQTATDEKARRDHRLAWEFAEPNAGEARLRQEVVVQGDRVGEWQSSVKVPEAWERARAEEGIASIALRWLKAPVIVLFCAFTVVLLVVRIRNGEMAWKTGLVSATIVSAAWLTHALLGFDSLLEAYPTSIAAPVWLVGILVGLGIAAAAIFGSALLTGALVGALFPVATALWNAPVRRSLARDALASGLVALGVLAGCSALVDAIAAALPSGRILGGVLPPSAFDSRLPFLDALCLALVAAFWIASLGAIVAAILARHVKQVWLQALLAAALVISFGPAAAVTVPERVVGAAIVATWLALAVTFAALFLRRNALAWIVAPFATLAIWNALRLLGSPDGYFRWNGAVLLAITAGILAWFARGAFSGAWGDPAGPAAVGQPRR